MAILKAIQPSAAPHLSPCEILKKPTVKAIKHSRKRVSFAESKNQEYANTTMSESECRALWHTPYEFKKMKEHTNLFAKQAVKQDRAHSDDNKSYSNIIIRVYDACCSANCETQTGILSEEIEKDLIFLVGKANTRTGLERLIVRDLAYDKRFRRSESVKSVLKIQAQTIDPHSTETGDRIRVTSEAISRASRLFARHLASALESSLR
eukprot:scaffold3931_cov172-Amphora_coffeaeformis.AAC.10